jgi:hypothetical protein
MQVTVKWWNDSKGYGFVTGITKSEFFERELDMNDKLKLLPNMLFIRRLDMRVYRVLERHDSHIIAVNPDTGLETVKIVFGLEDVMTLKQFETMYGDF